MQYAIESTWITDLERRARDENYNAINKHDLIIHLVHVEKKFCRNLMTRIDFPWSSFGTQEVLQSLSKKLEEMEWKTDAMEKRMQDMTSSSVMMNRVLLSTQEAIEELR